MRELWNFRSQELLLPGAKVLYIWNFCSRERKSLGQWCLRMLLESNGNQIARMLDESYANQILTASPSENWRRPPGCPRTMWMKTTQQDLKSVNLSLNKAIDVAQNRPLWTLMSTSGTTCS